MKLDIIRNFSCGRRHGICKNIDVPSVCS